MKKLLFILFALVAMVSCTTKRVTILPSTIEASPTFKMFWAEYSDETASLKSLKHYTPSEQLVSAYGLQGEDYVVSGFIYTDDSFNAQSFNIKGASINDYQAYVYSYRVPLRYLEQMLTIKGIQRIEISKPTNLKLN